MIRTSLVLIILLSFATQLPAENPLSIELKPFIGRLRTVSVEVGEKQHNFLFDTAGGVTILTPEVAENICKPFGRITLSRMNGELLKLEQCGMQSLKLKEFETSTETALLDLMALLPKNVPKIGGLLALNAFRDQILTIDLKNNLLIIETEHSLQERIANMVPLAMRVSTTASGNSLDVFVGVQAEQQTLWFELDSGNLDDVLISPHAVAQMGVTLPNIELHLQGLGTPLSVTAKEKDLIYDGVINSATMEQLIITIDFLNKRMWGKTKSS